MKKIYALIVSLLFISVSTSSLVAEELDQIFKKVDGYVTEKNFPKALEELSWARKEIEKMNSAHLQAFFPDELAGFKGADFEANSAMGITNIERTYKNNAEKVKMSLTGMGSGSGAAGGLAAIGRMAAMMGNQPGMDSFRVQGKTATLQQRKGSKRAELSIFLESGSVVKLETSTLADASTLKKMAESIKVEELDKYLRGTS